MAIPETFFFSLLFAVPPSTCLVDEGKVFEMMLKMYPVTAAVEAAF